MVSSFVIDGVYNGIGTVLLFFPIIVVMFFFLSLLQDTGYMARVAFFMDRALRRIGLSGRSIVPMIMGFGCTVPAVMATRTLPSERDRKLTILLTPYMSCVTKLAIYGFIASAFFPRQAGWIMIGLYLLGVVVAIVIGFILNRSAFKGEAVPFVVWYGINRRTLLHAPSPLFLSRQLSYGSCSRLHRSLRLLKTHRKAFWPCWQGGFRRCLLRWALAIGAL